MDEEDIIEDDPYNEESREMQVDDDSMDAGEAGFMQGYEDAL
ncbi:MAG TPA: hypothetical protein VJH97_05645 [Candidatus Nanoarchaeia archaeon]|nr:hypothetical protein [Candidatus Nanoarchaeia archaeon]